MYNTHKKNKVGPLVAKKNHSVPKIDWHLDLGPNNAEHEFEKDPLQTKGFRAHTREKEVGPQVATNITRWVVVFAWANT